MQYEFVRSNIFNIKELNISTYERLIVFTLFVLNI